MSLSNVMKGFRPEKETSYIMPESRAGEGAPKQEEKQAEYLKQAGTYDREVAAVLKKAHEEAEEILKGAYIKAKEIGDAAEIESNRLYDKTFNTARTDGYNLGYGTGIAKAKEEYRNEIKLTISELMEVSRNLEHQIEEFVDESKTMIIDLAAEIARKVVGDNFVFGDAAFYSMFEQIVKEIPPAAKLILTVSGVEYRIIALDPERLQKLAKGFDIVEIHRDDDAASGTVQIESPILMLDASLDRQIDSIKKELNAYTA